ncbi:MAG: hypothetical protein ACQEP5_06000 [Actinomycetota bacterium]
MKARINISLFLVSFSVFIYQVCLLRVLSVADFYHFAFLIVSVALLGFGISGSFLPFFVNRIKDETLLYLLFSFCFSVSVIVSFLVINLVPFDSFKIAWEASQVFYLFIYYLFLMCPFFFGGCFIGYAFYGKQKAQITYFFNLAGSSLGAIAFLILMPVIQQTKTIMLASFLGLVSVFLLTERKHIKRFLALGILFILAAASFYVFLPDVWDTRISPYKSLPAVMRYPDSRLIYTRQDSSTRIDVVQSSSIKSAPGLSLTFGDAPPPQLGLTVDGDNLSPVTRAEGNDLDFLKYLPQAVFLEEKEYGNVLVIEPGGGLDVLCSLYYGIPDIHVVQDNGLAVDLLKGPLASYSGRIYNDKRVKVTETCIRNYSLATDRKFDLIILSLSDSFHPVASGAYSLNENYTYSIESIASIMGMLAPDGRLAVTRWAQSLPSENLKIIGTLAEAAGKDISPHVFAYRSWSTLTTVYRKSGYSSGEIDSLKYMVDKLNYDLVYYRGMEAGEANIYNRLQEPYFHQFFKEIIEGDSKIRQKFYAGYYFNIQPAADNQPYFFNFFKTRQIPDIIRYFGKGTQPFGGGGYLILAAALLISIILSVFLILVPVRTAKIGINLKKDYGYLLYFLAIGLGFFFIELPLMQIFILILGKPSYSVAVILFSLMLFAGLGSIFSNYRKVGLLWVVSALITYIIAFMIFFRFSGHLVLARPLAQRFMLTIALIAPAGFLMGMPFPLGIARAKEENKEIIPWLWAINGCASVVGSVSAVMISIHIGFLAVLGLSCLAYLAAFLAYRRISEA